MTFKELREQVYYSNVSLLNAGLVTMHSGNASGIDRESGILLIKPSGIDYHRLKPEDLVAIRLDGSMPNFHEIPDGICSNLKPSVDTRHHIGIYLADNSICGVVHTHSNYATAWSIHEKEMPCALTAMADEFGGNIPCAPYVDNQDDNIVKAILKYRNKVSPAILLGHHGVFTFGKSVISAYKSAVMVEDLAKTIIISKTLGSIQSLSTKEITKWYERYHSAYGQNNFK